MPSTERLAALAVLAASASAMLGGFAIVATRVAVPDSNALSVAFLRFLGASVLMLAFTLPRMPVRIARDDWLPVIALGVLQFGVFSWLFTSALQHIPAARGALVLSTQPLITLALAVLLRRESLTVAKISGGVIALAAVGFALGDRVVVAGGNSIEGDLYMFGAALTGSFFNVASGYYLRKYPATMVGAVMIPAGAVALLAAIAWQGDWSGFGGFSVAGWVAIAYLMTLGGAFTFFLWIWALEHTTPSRVAITVTMNPVSATALGALVLAEPVTWRVLIGLSGIIGGIAIANWGALMRSIRGGG
jgi:drug/metabolite transporter (DMT)-like permease